MDSPFYPYATFEKDGYRLSVVQRGEDAVAMAADLAPEEKRLAAKPGDIVKLIFEYRDAIKDPVTGQEYGSEHMWVEITDYGDGCLVGILDNSPGYTPLLRSGDAVAFHPKHIIDFWDAGNSA